MLLLTDLPIETFLDYIFPFLPVPDLLNLGCTSRYFAQLTSDEALWHRRIREDFNFSGSETARKNGWRFLYQRLSHPKVYVWGERSQGRLGLTENQLPQDIMRDSVPYPVQLHLPGVRIVTLVAGGWSFHALDSQGDVYVWGVLDGTSAALRSEGYSIPSKRTEGPMRLSLSVKIRSISCGRSHSMALDANFDIWTCTSWGRPFMLLTPLLDKSSPETTPLQVSCGWSFSAVLAESGDILVYWPLSGRMGDAIAAKSRELDELGGIHPTRALPTSSDRSVIPCYTWTMQGFHPVKLPPIPSDRLPRLYGTGLSEDEPNVETKLVKIASMEGAIVGLTNKGHILLYRLQGEESNEARGHWEYLSEFCEVERVRQHPAFTGGPVRLVPPETLLITHISAQFRTFVAYSTGPYSMVLMGKLSPAGAPEPQETISPNILPSLQNRGVISVVLGDYHYGALTNDGKLLTWGAFSKGALGLGDPTKIHPAQPGGYDDEDQLRAAATRWNILRFPPPEVTVPTEVGFNHGERKRREKYCFAAAASGWHIGALVIDLESDDEKEAETELDESAVNMPGAFPSVNQEDQPPLEVHAAGFPILPPRGGRGVRLGLALARRSWQRGPRGGGSRDGAGPARGD